MGEKGDTLKTLQQFWGKILKYWQQGHKRRFVAVTTAMLGLLVIGSWQGFYGAPETTAQEPTATPTRDLTALDSPIVVDHNSVELFEQIPEQYIQAAENLDMLFIDRSVGGNISYGLGCLDYPSDEDATYDCSKNHDDPNFRVDPSVLNWYRPGGYNRANWDYRYWEGDCTSWDRKVNCFINMTSPVINQYDVVSFQFSYLEVDSGSSIDDLPGGYFWNNANRMDVYDQEAYEAQHPDKVFIYWTTSLARGIGSPDSVTFNNQMRQYANDNDKILFDVADILSHDPDGNPCYDNRDGVPYTGTNGSENFPNDGLNTLAICQHYTSEFDGGHLGNAAAGMLRVSKAFWVLMAQIAGWDPAAAATPPTVETVTPVDGADNVPSDQALVINFSEAMVPASVTYTLNPNPGGLTPAWGSGNTQLTLSHNNFAPNTPYSATVNTGTDVDGNALTNAPFTWEFMSTGPRSDLNIDTLARTNQFATICFTPGCSITYTLTIANGGSIYPATATVAKQWTPAAAIDSIRSIPAGCTGNLGNGTVTCNNINLSDATPRILAVVLDTTEFTGAIRSTAIITLTGAAPGVFDPPGNNTDIAVVFLNPTLSYLPIIIKN